MRFAKLSLERYGHFEGCELNFRPGEPDLHVIYGANEAGKTMSLAAVSDLLFGFGTRSPYNFRFDYSLLRVGAVLEEDGQPFPCRRRKATSGALVDAGDRPLDEGVLLGMLKGQTRDTFRLSFSLDQDGLRKGGRAMVEAKDDVGQALFAAGSGLTGVAAELNKLEDEADAIWGPRAAARRTYTQVERELAESVRAVRDKGLKPKVWTDARTALEQRKRELTVLEERRDVLLDERRKAERTRRIGPHVRLRAELLEEIGTHVATVALTPQREELAVKAMEAAEVAERARIAAERLGREAEERAEALAADSAVLAEAVAIEALVENRGAAAKAALDLTSLTAEKGVGEKLVTRLRGEIGAGSGAAPSRVTVSRLRELAREHAEMQSALRELELTEADLVARQKPLAARLADAGLSETLPALVAAVDAARRLGSDVDDRCAAARRRVVIAEEGVGVALSRLSPRIGSIDELIALPNVTQDEIDAAKAELSEHRATVTREETTAARLIDEATGLKLQIEALSGEGSAVSAEALAEAREARDAAWGVLRGHIVKGSPLADHEDGVKAYEGTVGEVDALADKRYALAEASGRLAELVQRRAERSLEAEQATVRAEAATKALDLTRDAWARRLTDAGLPDVEPARLQAWLANRDEAVDAQSDLVRLREEADAGEGRRAAAIHSLLDQISVDEADAADDLLAPILLRAERLRIEGEERDQQYRVDRSDLQQIEENLASQQRRRIQLSEAANVRATQWTATLEGSGLDLFVDAAEARLSIFEDLRATMDDDARLEQRIAGIERDAKQFETSVTALADGLGVPAGAEPAARLEQLRTRLLEARATDRVLGGLSEERERRQREAEEATAELDAANQTLAPVLAETGAADVAALAGAIEASRALRQLRQDLADAERQILAGGDGYPLVELVAAAEKEDPDQVATKTEAIERDLAELNAAVSEAATAHGDARRAFAALEETPGSAADAAADAEQARAEMSVQAESYLLKRTQAMTLRWAMEQYRERHQDPLLVRASQLFSTLTLGRYTALKIEPDGTALRLLGVCDDGRTVVDVGAMSEGTTDQLFLALRLAAVEQSIASGVRLPFLADDLFVNFDDERAEAGFRVLAKLARSTQVLFFTHHAHLAAIARTVVGAELHSECALA